MERGLYSTPKSYNSRNKKAGCVIVEAPRVALQEDVIIEQEEDIDQACSTDNTATLWDETEGLRVVFNMCDIDKKGFITVKAFEQLAKTYLSDIGTKEALNEILLLLEENSTAVSFEKFCHSIQTVYNPKGVDVNSEDSSYNTNDDTSLEDDRSSISNPCDWTFNEYDIMTDQDENMASMPTDAYGWPVVSHSDTQQQQHNNNFPDVTDSCNIEDSISANVPRQIPLITTNGVKVRRNEEYFEDFGDLLSTDCEPDSVESDDVDAVSASSSQLQLRSLSANNSPRRSLDDLYTEYTAETDVLDLNNKVRSLERKLNDLLEDQVGNSSQQSKLKSENEMLIKRVYMLEEQLHETRIRSESTIDETKRKFEDMLSRKDKDHRTDVDRLQIRLQDYQHENIDLREETPRLKNQTEILKHSNDKFKEALNDRSSSLKSLESAYDKQADQLKMERERRETEKKQFQQAISAMTIDLNELHQFKVDVDLETKCRSPSFAEMPGRYRELQMEVTKLRKETISLRENNEELTAQLLSQNIQEGQDLLEEQKASPTRSLAHELETATKEQLMSALKEQEEQNNNLRAYVDRVLLAVLESNPAILEVTKHC